MTLHCHFKITQSFHIVDKSASLLKIKTGEILLKTKTGAVSRTYKLDKCASL